MLIMQDCLLHIMLVYRDKLLFVTIMSVYVYVNACRFQGRVLCILLYHRHPIPLRQCLSLNLYLG